MGADSDSALLLRWYRQHDPRAFREIATRHSSMVFATCKRVLGDAGEAEDVTQECFVALAQRTATPPDSLPSWLHVLAVRRSLNRRRAAHRRAERERLYSERSQRSEAPDWDLVMDEVDEAIAELPEDLRNVVVLYFLEELSQQAIAAKLNISQPTVSRRIDEGIANVRRTLAKKGVTLTAAALAASLRANAAEATPASLSASLGKLALVGNTNSVVGSMAGAGAAATTIGGLLLMKKFGVLAGVLVIVTGVIWYGVTSNRPEPPPSPAAPVSERPPSPQDEAEEAAPEPAPVTVAAAEPITGTISGRVFDASTSEGIEGVKLTVEWGSEMNERRKSATTDASGIYVLDDLSAESSVQYRIRRGSADGYRAVTFMDTKTVQLPEGGVIADLDFALKPEIILKGTVVNMENRPIADARVRLSGGMDAFISEDATTDQKGTFVFRNLPATSNLFVMANKGDDFVSRPTELVLPEEGISDLLVVLEAACSLSGVVVDHAGNPLPHFEVVTSRRPISRVDTGKDKKTDGAGRFHVRRLAPGSYEIAAWNPKFSIYGAEQSGMPIELQPGEHLADVTVVYDRQLKIAGWVRNADGEPIAHATVDVSSPRAGGDTVETDDAGFFEVTELQQGAYGVTVGAPGYMRAELYGVAAGTDDLIVEMPPPFRVTGMVTDAQTHEPIPEFEVVLTVNWEDGLTAWSEKGFERISAPDGRFELTQLQLYRAIVAARAPGYATDMTFLDLTGPPYEHEVNLELEPGGDLDGRVVDSNGSPIAHANVFYGHASTLGDRAAATTGDDGRFSLHSFPADDQLVSAYHPDFAVASMRVDSNGNRSRPLEITLPSGGWIQGTVQFADGVAPVPCVVYASSSKRHFLDLHGDVQSDGTYGIERIAPGEADVILTVDTAASREDAYSITKQATVIDGSITTVDFTVAPVEERLEGLITYPKGAFPRSVSITLKIQTPAGEVMKARRPNMDGSFAFDDIPAGSGTIEIDANFLNHRRIDRHVPVDVPRGEPGYVDIRL